MYSIFVEGGPDNPRSYSLVVDRYESADYLDYFRDAHGNPMRFDTRDKAHEHAQWSKAVAGLLPWEPR